MHLKERIAARLEARRDTELEQSLVRLAVTGAALLYFVAHALITHGEIGVIVIGLVSFGVYFAASLGILGWIAASPTQSPIRRVSGAVLDMSGISLIMSLYGDVTSPLYVLYLWVISGNGLRYGNRYLAASAVLAMAGFGAVVATSEFWRSLPTLSLGLWIGLGILPAYMATLIRRLTRARAEAEAANRAKSEFLANMSHEIRTPLHGVLGLIDLLAETRLEKRQQETVATIKRSADHLLGVIDEILDFEKLEAGKVQSEEREFDLHELVHGVFANFRAQADKKGLRLRTHYDASVPWRVCGDEQHLRQVLLNLVSNAVKFTERGGVDIYIRRTDSSENSVRVSFDVVDTGVGIADDVRERIFDSFTQADGSTTRRYGGTGLGTTIAKRLTELMGGTLELRSEIGRGSVFTVTVALAVVCDAPVARSLRGRVALLSADTELSGAVLQWLDLWGMQCTHVGRAPQSGEESELARGTNVVLIDEASVQEAGAFARTFLGAVGGEVSLILLRRHSQPNEPELFAAGYDAIVQTPIEKPQLYGALHACRMIQTPPGTVDLAKRREKADRLKILVADDNEINAQVARAVLERAGHRVHVVVDGDAALDTLEHDQFDVVALDMQLPGHSGPDVIRLHRYLSLGRDETPFLVLTANTTAQARSECEEAGADGFLTKPYDKNVMLRIVEQLGRKGRQAKTLAVEASEASDGANGATGEEIFSEQAFDNLAEVADSSEFVQRVAKTYLTDSEVMLERIAEAARTGCFAECRDHAHALRGNASYVGAAAVARACSAIMSTSNAELAQRAESLLERLSESMQRVRPMLTRRLEQLPARSGASRGD